MTKSVDEYVFALSNVQVRAVWSRSCEELVNGLGETWHKPAEMGIVISWSAQDIGFGELTFRFTEDGMKCDGESMGQEFVEAVLVKLARQTRVGT